MKAGGPSLSLPNFPLVAPAVIFGSCAPHEIPDFGRVLLGTPWSRPLPSPRVPAFKLLEKPETDEGPKGLVQTHLTSFTNLLITPPLTDMFTPVDLHSEDMMTTPVRGGGSLDHSGSKPL